MADDKSPLTRRRVLGGMATIGAAGAVGTSAWARFTDDERKNISAKAGTLDLQFNDFQSDGSWTGWQDGPIDVDLGTFANRQKKVHCELIRNNGTVAANEVSVNVPSDDIEQRENGRNDPEKEAGDNDGTGELLEFIQVWGFFLCQTSNGYELRPCWGGGNSFPIDLEVDNLKDLVYVDPDGFITLDPDVTYSDFGPVWLDEYTDTPVDVDLGGDELASGTNDGCLFCMVVQLDEPEGYDNANIAQGDGLTVPVDVTLAQDSQSSE